MKCSKKNLSTFHSAVYINDDGNLKFYCKIDNRTRDATAAPGNNCSIFMFRFSFAFHSFSSFRACFFFSSWRHHMLLKKGSPVTWNKNCEWGNVNTKTYDQNCKNASWGKLKDHSCISQTHFEVGWVEVLAEKFARYFEEFLKRIHEKGLKS